MHGKRWKGLLVAVFVNNLSQYLTLDGWSPWLPYLWGGLGQSSSLDFQTEPLIKKKEQKRKTKQKQNILVSQVIDLEGCKPRAVK